MIRIERHEFGPRCYVLGRRIHECYLGLAFLVVSAGAAIPEVAYPFHLAAVLVAFGAWMVVKDFRDFFPRWRDTAAWRPGPHQRHLELRTARRGDWIPVTLGAAAAVVALGNVASALTPSLKDRLRLLDDVGSRELVPLAHALALPAAGALLVIAFYLVRRRRVAWLVATGLLVALGALDLLKGLDVEEALASWMLAGLLVWGRDAFYVRPDDHRMRAALERLPLIAAGAVTTAFLALLAAHEHLHPGLSIGGLLREALDLLTFGQGSVRFAAPFRWVPDGVHAVGAVALAAALAPMLRPLAAPCHLPGLNSCARARRIVRRHGEDTLSFFKLRRDAHYLFSADGRAFLAYRVHGGTLLVSGDPVGPEAAMPGLVRDLFAFAEARGLKVAVLGAGRSQMETYRKAGLSALYIGDEALVDTRSFSLEGRPIRKVRQSVTRLEKAGYQIELRALGDVCADELATLERVSERWRNGAAEKGFSMAMDRVGGDHQDDSMVVVARDGDRVVRGFLHFVPCYGRPAVSLSAMRREHDTPNGLTEFMVARGIELLRARGVEEVSLNFATFARCLHDPGCRLERLFGKLILRADGRFQIESLYRFNAKFFPRWEPRYLLFEGALALPRAGLAALQVEGQLPTLRLRRTRRS